MIRALGVCLLGLVTACDGPGERAPLPPAPSASVATTTVSPPAPAPPPLVLPGRLYFVSERDGDREVYSVLPDGSGETRVTRREGPDYVAPIAGAGPVLLVEVDEADGGHVERLAVLEPSGPRVVGRPSGRVRGPVLVPGGVVFESDAESFRDLYRLDLSTGRIARLTRSRTGAFEPSLGRAGAEVVYASSDEGDPDLYALSLDAPAGAPPRRLTWSRGEDSGPQVSPDGQRIAFLSVRAGVQRIVVMDRDGARPTLLQSALPPETRAERDPAWSPDGTALAWIEQQEDRSLLRVTELASGKETVRAEGAFRDEAPVWSPDGRAVAFASERARNVDVYVVPRAGGPARRVTVDAGADWLPRWGG